MRTNNLPSTRSERGTNDDEPMLDNLRRELSGWSPEIHDFFDAARPLGNACHPRMPNLSQGGAMAIEDTYVLGRELHGTGRADEVDGRLRAYECRRFVRRRWRSLCRGMGATCLWTGRC